MAQKVGTWGQPNNVRDILNIRHTYLPSPTRDIEQKIKPMMGNHLYTYMSILNPAALEIRANEVTTLATAPEL